MGLGAGAQVGQPALATQPRRQAPAVVGDERLERVVDDLDETIKDIRRTIYQLHASPGQSGLRSELDEVLEQAEDALGFAPSMRTDGPLSAIPDEVGADLVAVLRESLTNAAKHAGATAVVGDDCLEGAAHAHLHRARPSHRHAWRHSPGTPAGRRPGRRPPRRGSR